MSDLDVTIKSFEAFLAEDAKALSDANHHIKNGDAAADKVVEPGEHKRDEGGIKTADARQAAANKKTGDGKMTSLKEAEELDPEMKVGEKKNKIDDSDKNEDDDDDKEGGEDKKKVTGKKKSDEEE